MEAATAVVREAVTAANALLANVALMCWAGAVPFSFVLHIVTRTLVRTLRKKRALARGKRVDGDRSLIVDDVLFDAASSRRQTRHFFAPPWTRAMAKCSDPLSTWHVDRVPGAPTNSDSQAPA